MPVMSEAFLQMQLAKDPNFLTRLSYIMVQHARTVKDEPQETPQHLARTNYATTVINSPQSAASNAATMICGGTNLIGTVTLEDSGPVTSVTDPALLSQVATFWTALSGADTTAPAP
jgi:hypothetical protein